MKSFIIHPVTITAVPGINIGRFVADVVEFCKVNDCSAHANFNDRVVAVNHNSEASEILSVFDELLK